MDKVNKSISSALQPLSKNPVKGLLTAFFILYGPLAAPQLPALIHKLFGYFIFKVIFIALMIWSETSDALTSLLVSVSFVILMNLVSGSVENFTVLHPKHRVLAGCSKVTVKDLVDVFDGDKDLLEKTIRNVGVPHNVTLDDFHAPEIATYLINYGYSFGSKHEECDLTPGENFALPK